MGQYKLDWTSSCFYLRAALRLSLSLIQFPPLNTISLIKSIRAKRFELGRVERMKSDITDHQPASIIIESPQVGMKFTSLFVTGERALSQSDDVIVVRIEIENWIELPSCWLTTPHDRPIPISRVASQQPLDQQKVNNTTKSPNVSVFTRRFLHSIWVTIESWLLPDQDVTVAGTILGTLNHFDYYFALRHDEKLARQFFDCWKTIL